MAINRVDYPANLTAQSDFSAHGELIETRFMDQSALPLRVVSGNIPQGAVFQIGGVVYRADSDTAITGTASDYVKITPDGATASAAYVADLTGVTWSAQYNGYYDASENLYVFDEGKALAAEEISTVFGRYLMQQPNGDVAVGGVLTVVNDVGNVGWFVTATRPRRILCDGSTISKITNTEYTRLVDVLKAEAGADTGHPFYHADADKAKIPNLVNRFIRGMPASGRDSGEFQADAFASHTHTADIYSGATSSYNIFGADSTFAGVDRGDATTHATGGAETRPDNVSLYPLIGY